MISAMNRWIATALARLTMTGGWGLPAPAQHSTWHQRASNPLHETFDDHFAARLVEIDRQFVAIYGGD